MRTSRIDVPRARSASSSPGDASSERSSSDSARDPAVVRVLAPPAKPVVLLGEVRELEVQAERAQDERLLARREASASTSATAPSRRAFARASRRISLDELEQPRAFLLDEHARRGSSRAGGRRGGAAQR